MIYALQDQAFNMHQISGVGWECLVGVLHRWVEINTQNGCPNAVSELNLKQKILMRS
jgi:hypothetical protein